MDVREGIYILLTAGALLILPQILSSLISGIFRLLIRHRGKSPYPGRKRRGDNVHERSRFRESGLCQSVPSLTAELRAPRRACSRPFSRSSRP